MLQNYALFLILLTVNITQSMHNSTAMASSSKAAQERTCSICLEDQEADSFYTLQCGHSHCLTCLNSMTQLAMKEKRSSYLACPSIKCHKKLDMNDIKRISQEQETPQRVARIMELEEHRKSPHFKPCPTVNCEGYFIDTYGVGRIITCPECRESYCSFCLKTHKQNISCEKAAKLISDKKVDPAEQARAIQEKMTKEWKTLNIQSCPECKTPIQKQGGCPKMRCDECNTVFRWDSHKDA